MAVSPGKIKALQERLDALEIYERDIIEKFVRSQGKGGQKLNKTSTCVYLRHIPSGVEVKCQEDRSQTLNRFLARRILADKIEELITGGKSEKVQKIRKQKDRRARKTKARDRQKNDISS
ncbi:MAG TPA: peptide chain release factor-like protein [Desulfomonilia bacterium]